jgi:hypothetical protein
MSCIKSANWLILTCALCVSIPHFAVGEILHETGTLRGFLGGSCPDCEYDNWISHISEGIASPGYNNYGPNELDPQTNGFGRYQQIPSNASGDSTIAAWYAIFSDFLNGDTTGVDTRLAATGLDAYYHLAVLSDPPRQYYILREVLNMGYHDEQLTPLDSTDDVWGSFYLGWGVYVFSPSASKPWVLVEMPHPTDDYPSPFIGTAVFEMMDAGLLMIAGAGREVLWTNQGDYNNSKSLSDPSRVYNSVFNTAHRAFVDRYSNSFALQLHGYDSDPHEGQLSLVISAGADDDFPNEPILDRCTFNDMISLTPYIMVPAGTCGNHPDVTIQDYYQIFYEGGYAWQGESPQIPTTSDLYGFGQNQQAVYSNAGTREYVDGEDFMHVEMDEMPDPIQDTITVYYRTDLPGQVTFENFANAIAYFIPAFEALNEALLDVPLAEIVSAAPDPLQFPQTMVYGTSTLRMRFRNESLTDYLTLMDVHSGDQIFSVAGAPIGTVLPPGRQCWVTIDFNPQDAFNYHRILTFSTNAGCRHAELVGTGLGGVAVLSPSSFDFGPVDSTQTDTTTVYLQNVGNFPLLLTGLIDAPPHFSFVPIALPDTLLTPNQRIPLHVVFNPMELGMYMDTMYVILNTYANDTLALEVKGQGAVVVSIFADDFSQDRGWTGYGGAGEWARGPGMGGHGDDNYGGPDPIYDHTPSPDNMLIGNDLTTVDGDYEANLGSTYWLTSPIMDCSAYENVQLKYWRWLGVERNQYDHAYLQAFNGSNWVTIWANGDVTIDEGNWNQRVIDVSQQADGNPLFQIRFGIGTTDGSWQYCGWNIDDLEIMGTELVIQPDEVFFDDFSTDLGWTGYGSPGEWTRGSPLGGLGDDGRGGPDPTVDHSPGADNFVAGNDLTSVDGDYEANLAETYWLTSPIIDCSGFADVQLSYWRWLGIERNQYDHVYLQVFNGTDWVPIWGNGGVTLDENLWRQFVIDVSQQADGNPQFQIRFGMGPTDNSYQYCGWNIDDVSIRGRVLPLVPIADLILMRYMETSIFLTWSPVPGASYYRVYRGDAPDFEIDPGHLLIQLSAPDTSYVDTDALIQFPNAFYRVTSGN